jgi:hypothetical protein
MNFSERITNWMLSAWAHLTGLALPGTPQRYTTGSYKLGRKAVKHDTRTLRIGSYLSKKLPPPPASVDWSKHVTDWGMLLNDQLGDCTIAGAMHTIMGWSVNTGTSVQFADKDALAYYEKFDGYDPSDPSSDAGGVLLDVLNAWRTQGINGHKVSAFASVAPTSITEVKQVIALFGPLYCGLSFPNSAMGAPQWQLTRDTSIAGGHCVVMIGYTSTGPVFISWGALYQATWAFFSHYFAPACDGEIYAAISPDWFAQSGISPAGLNLQQLQADLSAIR